jgi:hypothetical protein
VRLALDLDGMTARYGIAIKNIVVEAGSTADENLIVLEEYAGPYEIATVSFSFVADYEGFKGLLAEMEKSLRLMDVRSITFIPNDSGFYEFQISVETYWLKDSAPIQEEPSPTQEPLNIP